MSRTEIDPRIRAEAEKIRSAYVRLGEAQDPRVKGVLRGKVLEAIQEATIVTTAIELQRLTKLNEPSNN